MAVEARRLQAEPMALPVPVHVVCPDDRVWPELRDGGNRPIGGSRLSRLSAGILNAWLLRTCYQLRQTGLDITISAVPRREAINIVSIRDFGRRARPAGAFLLVPIGDAHRSMLANFRIFQNGLQRTGQRACTISHWPQPGIIPRDPARGAKLARLAYKGHPLNLDPAFQSDAFQERLAGLGVALDRDACAIPGGAQEWNDYSAADAVLAVRDMTGYNARKKPASKLVNAWFAEVPAILGPEPAYRELRRSPLDYIEVHSPEQALDAVQRLKESPDLYRAMVENGRRRRDAFSEERLTRMWLEVLAGPVAAAFRAWHGQPAVTRWLGHVVGLLLEGPAQKLDGFRIRQGRRILSTTTA